MGRGGGGGGCGCVLLVIGSGWLVVRNDNVASVSGWMEIVRN